MTEADRLIEVDGFLMPAVADRHVHIELSSPSNVLRGGVTAVRDLAWPPERIFPLADASELPTFDGPLIRAAGAMLGLTADLTAAFTTDLTVVWGAIDMGRLLRSGPMGAVTLPCKASS